jgi:pSer/pThr/pTyr-binding forkhead associated (FHA) protein
MFPHRRTPGADAGRKPARDLIDAVLTNMRQNVEQLKYSVLAPSRYVVYLHPTEYARLEGVVPILQREARRALTEALDVMNRQSVFDRYAARVFGIRQVPVQSAAGDWDVTFLPDPDGELKEGDILVDSELLLQPSPELGAGSRTRRITTVQSGSKTTSRERVADTPVASARPAAPSQLARIAYEDNTGRHTHDVVKDSVTIGRGGAAYPVDVRIVSSVDVSREHARIRRDPQSGAFFLIDLSSLGTTLNGRHVPRGYDDSQGTKRENGYETVLPARARIGLADTVYLDFETTVQQP